MRGRTAFFSSQLSSACSIMVFLGGCCCSLSLPSDRTSQTGLRLELISSIYPKVVPVKVDHFSETFLCKSITEERFVSYEVRAADRGHGPFLEPARYQRRTNQSVPYGTALLGWRCPTALRARLRSHCPSGAFRNRLQLSGSRRIRER